MNLDNYDTLMRKLAQARAVLLALVATSDDGQFIIQHTDVMDAIWAIRDLVDDAHQAAGGLRATPKEN